jgi:hypothetical protein
MAFRGADAVSSESLSAKRVSYDDSVYKYENSNISERTVIKSDISHEDLHAFLCSSWHIQWYQLISHKARVFLPCLVRLYIRASTSRYNEIDNHNLQYNFPRSTLI